LPHIIDETEQLRFKDHHQTQVSCQAIAKSHIEQLRLRDLLTLIQDHSHVATPHNCSYIQDTQRIQKVFAFGGILGRKAESSRMDTHNTVDSHLLGAALLVNNQQANNERCVPKAAWRLLFGRRW
jgi:hypothetical protein